MTNSMGIKAKLGLNVFKPDSKPHIRIKPGLEGDPRLLRALLVCPAGLYSKNSEGKVELTIDGCLECGTCRLACGTEVLDWCYPAGGRGVQFRFG
ncbi:MAG: ferredoxin family protein [Syntrophomonadaceae bacterium]|jgi:ferredoxin like protein